VLEAVQFPAGVTDLDTGLTNVDGDGFTHDEKWERERESGLGEGGES
jgi:hypothetical protein